MAASVICVSRAEGAGGPQVGRLVANALGFRYADDEIVARAAEIGGLAAADVAEEERRKSALSRILRDIGRETLQDPEETPPGEPDVETIRSLVLEAIEQTAAEGRVVIVAHAASLALAGRAGVLRVLVTASAHTRARRIAEESGVDPDAARRSLGQSDAARAYYLDRFYDVTAELPTHYDLVLNTDVLTYEQAAEAICSLAHSDAAGMSARGEPHDPGAEQEP